MINEHSLNKKVRIANLLGIHARAASQLAKIAKNANSAVWLIKQKNNTSVLSLTEKADAKNILEILTLHCPKETYVTIQIENIKDMEILESMKNLIENKFGED